MTSPLPWKVGENRLKWYHWFLFPFAKKFIGCDSGTSIYSFIIFGKSYVYKIKQVLQSAERLD
jgi:hypothetical protein